MPQRMTNETWVDIEGYEGKYQVSDLGNVKSLSRLMYPVPGFSPAMSKEILLKPMLNKCGHHHVYLYKGDGMKKKHYVHRLVAAAFHPNPDGHPIVDHKDDCKTNNHKDNLAWDSVSNNNKYARSGRELPEGPF